MSDQSFELKGREIIDIPSFPEHVSVIRHFGVALTNEEAQEFIEKEYRVFGDDDGPFLVVRLPHDVQGPLTHEGLKFDFTIQPQRWSIGDPLKGDTGIICWLKRIGGSSDG